MHMNEGVPAGVVEPSASAISASESAQSKRSRSSRRYSSLSALVDSATYVENKSALASAKQINSIGSSLRAAEIKAGAARSNPKSKLRAAGGNCSRECFRP